MANLVSPLFETVCVVVELRCRSVTDVVGGDRNFSALDHNFSASDLNVMFSAIGSGPKNVVQSKSSLRLCTEARTKALASDIKLLGDKIEVAEKKVRINKKVIASNDLQLTV
ncbi:hypothetical protein F2Q68_00021597 [Brassica cretica]|uniref:Uncharacterized protein n=1 Tax=Brassica cretica TaxID=69181 RepID=A0A8S9G559_BRACR|nr:hypothetical protein F2Q68_00021597 [Brassica cretica]